MKLRIENNCIRIRLSMTEVEQLNNKGILAEYLVFGGKSKLVYEVCCDDTVDEMTAGFLNSMIVVRIPSQTVKHWAESSEVSIENDIDLENGGKMGILVEKDFKKLTRKDKNSQNDLYPNPRERKS